MTGMFFFVKSMQKPVFIFVQAADIFDKINKQFTKKE